MHRAVPLLIAALWIAAPSCAPSAGADPAGDAAARRGTQIVRVASVEALALLRLADGRRLRLSGVDERSDPLAEGDAAMAAARERLRTELTGREVELRLDPPRPADPNEARGEIWRIGPDTASAVSVNEQILARGDALLDLTRGPAAGDLRFTEAARRAAAAPSRRDRIPIGFQAGIVLPLYSKDATHDYGPRLREIRDMGAQWVEILLVWIVDRIDGSRVEPRWKNADWRDNRTPPDEDLVRTLRQAKDLGLRILLLPIVLPWKPGPEDWRGSLRPADRDAFFENYARYILRHADLAEQLDVDALSLGSELISLESRVDGDVTWWKRIARTARARFGGHLTYSANWDHYEEVGLWDDVDFVGMTSYFSLTKDPDATVEAMVEAWKPAQSQVAAFARRVGKPVVFTEVGYASVRGINTDPWNYKMDTELDLQVQDRCYAAFVRAFPDASILGGAYFYDWYGEGGERDRGYTPRGKPAQRTLRDYLERAARFPFPALDGASPRPAGR